MAKTVNHVILLGNVGQDPEIRSTPSGKIFANITLATDERFRDQKGNWQDHTEWHNLVAYDQRITEIVRDYVSKGSKLFVEGKIQTNSWNDKQSGQKRYRTVIVVSDLALLPGREEELTRNTDRYGVPVHSSSHEEYPKKVSQGINSTEITDADIPF